MKKNLAYNIALPLFTLLFLAWLPQNLRILEWVKSAVTEIYLGDTWRTRACIFAFFVWGVLWAVTLLISKRASRPVAVVCSLASTAMLLFWTVMRLGLMPFPVYLPMFLRGHAYVASDILLPMAGVQLVFTIALLMKKKDA